MSALFTDGLNCSNRSSCLSVISNMAERVGFEPTLGFPKHAFQACAFSRSATSPFIIVHSLFKTNLLFRAFFTLHSFLTWRRGRDLNPGWSYPHNSFRDCRLQPLGHLSVGGSQVYSLTSQASQSTASSCTIRYVSETAPSRHQALRCYTLPILYRKRQTSSDTQLVGLLD